MPEGNAVYFSAATQQVTWGKWTPKVNSSQCTCLVTRLFPQKRGRRDPGNEANNVPAQAMNFPHGETAAHEFGAWCVSTEDRTAPVWKTPCLLSPIQFYYTTAVSKFCNIRLQKWEALKTVPPNQIAVFLNSGSHSWHFCNQILH